MFTSPVGAARKVTPGPHALSGDEADGGHRCHKAQGQDAPQTKNKGKKTLLSNLWASSFSAGEDRPARAGEPIR